MAAAPPKIDSGKIAEYLRYSEGFTPRIAIRVDDPKPTIYPGYWLLTVHLRAQTNEAIRTYYITQDGEHIISGSLYDLNQSPFAFSLSRLKQEGAPATGPSSAAVEIYIFSDFECPYCREEASVLRQRIDPKYAKDVRLIFKDFPLEAIHPWARTAAIAGRCVQQQNEQAFWKFHDWIYANQKTINQQNVHEQLNGFAKQEHLDQIKWNACLADPANDRKVTATLAEGRQLGVEQTPTLFVNGRLLSGALDADQMNYLIELEVKRKGGGK